MISVEAIAISTDASGAGTAVSSKPISGRIVEVRMPNGGTAITATGGTADFTLTRQADGGTVLAALNQNAPWQYQPRPAAHTTSAGTTAYATGIGPVPDARGVPCDDYLQLVVASGQPSKAGTVYVHYER